MKKTLITMTTLALLSAGVPRAEAHGSGGAIAAGVVGGIGAGLLLSRVLEPRPVYAPVYVQPAPVVVQQPAQVLVQQAPQQVVVQQPVTTVQQPVLVQQPVVVQQPAVIYQPAPVVYSSPVYVRPVFPAPVVSFGFSFGHGPYYRHGYRHW